jgi:hypothetical protein
MRWLLHDRPTIAKLQLCCSECGLLIGAKLIECRWNNEQDGRKVNQHGYVVGRFESGKRIIMKRESLLIESVR